MAQFTTPFLCMPEDFYAARIFVKQAFDMTLSKTAGMQTVDCH